eukprot:TRINITY_DN684_c0_g1_i4.p1 TRINITY_DN684_c0_g1~~TRINITY_DN684_c0_g1_i4.p1  ORF type:complete len:149 (-),score=3.65 TRINITY_DN684_c0_g1_i4:119-565(-)
MMGEEEPKKGKAQKFVGRSKMGSIFMISHKQKGSGRPEYKRKWLARYAGGACGVCHTGRCRRDINKRGGKERGGEVVIVSFSKGGPTLRRARQLEEKREVVCCVALLFALRRGVARRAHLLQTQVVGGHGPPQLFFPVVGHQASKCPF